MQSKLDFLRLATWDATEHTYILSDIMERLGTGWQQSKWLQYSGWRKDGIFIGHGEQSGRIHCVINISGYHADEYYEWFKRWESLYCTRIDVQVTIPRPPATHLDEVYARIKAHTKSSLIQSETNDTLYVGARTSDIFIRLYEKPLDTMHLRLEYEIKGTRAKAAWRALTLDATQDELFNYYTSKAKIPSDIKDHFRLADDKTSDHAMNAEIAKDDQRTLDWLQSLDNSIMKALNNHNIGDDVKILVQSWANCAANLDRMNQND